MLVLLIVYRFAARQGAWLRVGRDLLSFFASSISIIPLRSSLIRLATTKFGMPIPVAPSHICVAEERKVNCVQQLKWGLIRFRKLYFRYLLLCYFKLDRILVLQKFLNWLSFLTYLGRVLHAPCGLQESVIKIWTR